MAGDSSQTLYTVVITGLKDKATRMRVAETLSSVSAKLPLERVLERLGSLPWTITRKATEKKAFRLVKLLQGLGAQTLCIPPLPGPLKYDPAETLIMPGAELLSHTQFMSATQFVPVPDEVPQPAKVTRPAKVSQPPAVPLPVPDTRPVPATVKAVEISREEEPSHPDQPPAPSPKQPGFFRKHIETLLWILLALGSTMGAVVIIRSFLSRFWR